MTLLHIRALSCAVVLLLTVGCASFSRTKEIAFDRRCAEEFSQAYFVHRATVEAEYVTLDPSIAPPMGYADRQLMLGAEKFQPALPLVDCAANQGDQLALLVRGTLRLQSFKSAEDVAAGLHDLALSAEYKGDAPIVCSPILPQIGYECRGGLPESHRKIGLFFSNCHSELYHPRLAKTHLEHALRLGDWRANSDLRSLAFKVENPAQAHCTVDAR